MLVEVNAILDVNPIKKAQQPSYVKLLKVRLTLVISFSDLRVPDGLLRLTLPSANLD
ncbi:hypothetical protein D3C84_1303070 [compost metagenome]